MMASLYGYGTPQMVAAQPQQRINPPQAGGRDAVVIDGTPIRLVILAFSAAAGLTALKMAGFKFNVGVSS